MCRDTYIVVCTCTRVAVSLAEYGQSQRVLLLSVLAMSVKCAWWRCCHWEKLNEGYLGLKILCKSKITSECNNIFNYFGIKNTGASKWWMFSRWDLLLCHTLLSLLPLDSSSLPPQFFSWELFLAYYAEKTGLALFLSLKQQSYKLGMVTITSGTCEFSSLFTPSW